MRIVRPIVASLWLSSCLLYLGCGGTEVEQIATPSIRNVQPQTIVAGSPSVTLSVEGANFTTKAIVLWNGAKLGTSVIDANTLSAAVTGGSIASPGTGQLQVQDSQTGAASPSVAIAIVSAGENNPLPLAISTTPLPAGSVGAGYSTVLAANGGTTAYSWSVSSGSLPAGLSLSAATGTISGTPTASGTFSFTVTVNDSSSPIQTKSVATSITIAASPLTITSSTLASGIEGAAYSQSLRASGGTPAYSWSITSGSLPTGLTLAVGSGVLSGTPTTSGTFSLAVTVRDSSSPVQTKSVTTSITIAGAATSAFANVSVGTTPGRAIPSDFMGLSMEWGTAQTVLGDSTVGVDYIARQLLLNLTAYGSAPLNLRIGGNTTDSTGEPTSTTVQPFAELASARGNHFSLGVNLGSDNVSLAVDQARAYVNQMPAGSLDAIEIGNEPDMYLFHGLRLRIISQIIWPISMNGRQTSCRSYLRVQSSWGLPGQARVRWLMLRPLIPLRRVP